ncbi:protein kinase [Nocardia sp. NPDC051030]|uniref:serine/threonine-protein kinase n=1 Tax=Nocardia sp. NPDC051030 TaxID=3155162 RepID=UPI003426CF70
MGGQLRTGVIFAGYRIERLLGTGGMGEVYLARDRDLPRFIALKVLNRVASADEEVRQRFRWEANTIARLSHPNIVTIFASGEEEGLLWLSMAYVDGADLAAVLDGGPLELRRVAAVTAHVAAALDYANDAGVLHRDVKPANILLTANPREWVLLTDFGIAKSVHEGNSLTDVGSIAASFSYVAPERFHRAVPVDRRADVYSLGCTVFEMLTGVPPFPDGDPQYLMYSHLSGAIPAPDAVKPGLPVALRPVIARAMAKNPADRYATCLELSADLTAAITPAEAATRPVPTVAARPRSNTGPSRKPPASATFATVGRKPATPVPGGRKPATSVPGGRKPATSVPGGRRPATPVPGGRRPAAVPRGGNSPRLPLLVVVVTLICAAGVAVTGLIYSVTDTDSSSAAATSSPSTTSTRPTGSAVTSALAAGPAVDGCPSRRNSTVVAGTDPGGTASGPDAILAFQYAYYVLRSGTAARKVVADGSNISEAATLQQAIDSYVPSGTRYCVQVTPDVSAAIPPGSEMWTVEVTQQRPGALQESFKQTVTTRRDADRTLITAIEQRG